MVAEMRDAAGEIYDFGLMQNGGKKSSQELKTGPAILVEQRIIWTCTARYGVYQDSIGKEPPSAGPFRRSAQLDLGVRDAPQPRCRGLGQRDEAWLSP